ncbi:hypothetical protein DFQ01_12518 [Paenibacillus cellulosilyticus]|uniref:Gp5/Type VI secretion system Vgr protein OB-fold domain-containing protein n=1 Tax=Paenibacillus cellulosilyticus TaxID=375489 RepID=A0A2V2YN02_9BACL|nr:phage baseplate assembly protein V [Paenibacillus cellulosilyticus]PWV95675.1 hypothetical protein DFQ01_12518 [Paenibacillus cellulosilyticus]QKS47689.1 phage tail protein [Paenibacillus cellulosilyticus]
MSMNLDSLLGSGANHEHDRIYGVMIALVTNNQDPEGLARVKLTYPWRGGSDGASDESHWARMAVPNGGKERGMYFLPEVGDEVLVAFEHGDINHPYVLGSLWNGKDKPPGSNDDGNNNKRIIKSRSGHEIVLDDTDGKENVTITSKDGQTIKLADGSDGPAVQITDANDNSIVIDGKSNAITVTSTQKVVIKSSIIEMTADASMTLKSSGPLKIQGAIVQIN